MSRHPHRQMVKCVCIYISACEHTGNLVHFTINRLDFDMLVSCSLLLQRNGPNSLITAMLAHQFT